MAKKGSNMDPFWTNFQSFLGHQKGKIIILSDQWVQIFTFFIFSKKGKILNPLMTQNNYFFLLVTQKWLKIGPKWVQV